MYVRSESRELLAGVCVCERGDGTFAGVSQPQLAVGGCALTVGGCALMLLYLSAS